MKKIKNLDNNFIEALKKYYIIENHTREETCNKFGLNFSSLGAICREFNIFKSNKTSGLNATLISKEKLYIYYIVERHNIKECAKHFNTSEFNINKLISKYCLYKTSYKDIKLNLINSEDLYNYYVIENHNKKETCNNFNISNANLTYLLNKYCIDKNKYFKDIMSNVNKQFLYDLYVNKGNTKEEIAKMLNLTKSRIDRLFKFFNIDSYRTTYNNIINSANKEKIYQYYVVENHTRKETCNKFGLKNDMLDKIFKDLNFTKHHDINYYTNLIPKEELYNYYIVERHSKQECLQKFNLTVAPFQKLLKHYNITRGELNRYLKETISKDELVSYYSTHSHKETCLHFNINSTNLNMLIDFYNIHKQEAFTDTIDRIDEKTFIKYYIEENYSFEDICTKFNLNLGQIKKLRDYYGLKLRIGFSHYEDDIIRELKYTGPILKKDRKVLGSGQEIDIFFPNYKIGIEFNGLYWHSNLQKPKNYHINKSKLAEEKGIRLIHIYEDEWCDPIQKTKIISLLKIAFNMVSSKIYARNCEVKQITNSEAKPFNEANHLQGHRNAQVTYGLFYQGKLVQLMSFSKTKYNRNLKSENSWEIIRGCPGSNNIVVGGVSKLFSHFIKDYNPDSVFSYCDFNKFDGRGYEAIGMKFVGYTGPDKKWVLDFNTLKTINRSPSKYKELKEKSVAILWGAGSKKYLWEKPHNE